MAVCTEYKCDKCGDIQKSEGINGPAPDQFWSVGVFAKPVKHSLENTYTNFAIIPLQVCRKCLEGMGIYAQEKTKAEPTYNPPTLEQLIVELVQREIESREG